MGRISPYRVAALIPEMVILRQQDWTYQAIADHVGLHARTVRIHCTAAIGLTPRPPFAPYKHVAVLIPKMIRLRTRGLSYVAIGDRLGVAATTVQRHCKAALGITGPRSRIEKLTPEMLRLREQGYTYKQIAGRLSVHFSTVSRQCVRAMGTTLSEPRRRTIEARALRERGWSYQRIADYLGYPSAGHARVAIYKLARKGKGKAA